jgi:hypothetical protein
MLDQRLRDRRGGVFAVVLITTALLTSPALPGQSVTNPVPTERFVGINAELELVYLNGEVASNHDPGRLFQIHAVVGRDKWSMSEVSFSLGQTNYYSFDGTRIIEWTCSFGTNGNTGNRRSDSFPSADGNPSQTVNASDRLDLLARISWLAFCSPATLNNPNRKLYPPSEFWKEYINPSKLTERVERFKDDLGLPKRVLIVRDELQPVVDYGVSGTTNIAGWVFPKNFYLLEYRPTGEKGWVLELFARGKVSSIESAVFALTEHGSKRPGVNTWTVLPGNSYRAVQNGSP